jgi:long-chain acyl-CoA synthetase
MTIRDYVHTPAQLPSGTLTELLFESVDRFGDGPAYRSPVGTVWEPLSYTEALARIRAGAAALRSLGLDRGARAAILSENRVEWALADWACQCAGVPDVPVYTTLTPPQIAYILRDSEVRLVFCSSDVQLRKLLKIRAELPDLAWIVVMDPLPPGTGETGGDGESGPRILSWEAFLERGYAAGEGSDQEAFRAEALRATPEDVATILYTSGTTGDPKGVMLTHGNLRSNIHASSRVLPIDESDDTLSFLPLSHVFQRMVDYLLFSLGCTINYARSLELVSEDMKLVRPTIVVSVPRLYEKVHARVTGATGVKGALVQWAREVGDAWATERLAGREPGPVLRLVYALADRLVFRKVRAAMGGRLRYFVSGGAPLAPEINRFFYSAGILILEGYGLTETSPVTNVNSPEAFRIGTVGKPVPGTEIRIAGDGEILVRGPQVMKGYLNNPEATAAVITPDGWFHTGDVGEIDEDGFLRITDRKKDIIVTAGGKNIAPQPIENRIKQSRYVEQVVMLGDRRPYAVVLVVPTFDALEGWAREQGVAVGDRRALLENSRVQQLVAAEIQASVADLARFEQPKKIGLVPAEFTIESGELTPSQKVRRRIVERNYSELIDALYASDATDRTVFTA